MLKRKDRQVKEKILLRIRYFKRFRPWKKNGKWVLIPNYGFLQYDAVNLDINNTCNLRCRFCFNAFEPQHFYMTKELFSKVLPILPMTKDAGEGGTGFYLSCLYEPSLSPYFLEILEMLPVEARKKAFFTTNLCRPWDPEKLKRMLRTNLHHINISIETLNPERHEEISSSKHFPVFQNNLNALASLYPVIRGYKPKLRFITMILKINQGEILDIVNYCREKLYASQHELRTPYISSYENMAWNREQLLEPEECRKMEKALEKTGLPVIMDIHSKAELRAEEPEDGTSFFQETETGAQKAWQSQMDEVEFCMHPEFFFLRFHPSGICTLNVTKETFSIADTEHPKECYMDKLQMLCRRRAAAFLWEKGFASVTARNISMKVMLEELEATKAGLMIRGWYRVENREAEGNLLMVTVKGNDDKRWDFLTFPISRPDLDSGGGFALYIGRNIVTSETLTLEFLFVRKETMEKAFRYEYPYCIKWTKSLKEIKHSLMPKAGSYAR